MRASVSHDEIVVRKGFLGRETKYRVSAVIDFSEEEKTIIRKFGLGRHEAYVAEKDATFPKLTYTINDLMYERPHIRVFRTPLAARLFEEQLIKEILPKIKNYIFGNAAPRHPSSYDL